MSVSPRCPLFSPPKASGAVKVVFEKRANFVSYLAYPLNKDLAYFVEVSLLAISLINALACLFIAIKTVLLNQTPTAELNLEQSRLLGLGENEKSFLSRTHSPSAVQHAEVDKAEKDRQFSFNWLSAFQFGSFRSAFKPHSRHLACDGVFNRVAASNETKFSTKGASGVSPIIASSLQFKRPFDDECDRSLAAEVSSRTSPYSKPTSSIQTSKQLESLLENQSGSPIDFSSNAGVSTYNNLYGTQRRNAFTIGNQYPLLTTGSPSYELGTSLADEEHSKNVNDENGVISLVTGSRIRVSNNRVSLSPIPFDLLRATADLSSSGGSTANGEKTSNGRIVGNKNGDNDSTSFRIEHNARRKSPRKSSMSRRSESWERRRAVSVSPVSSASSSPFSAAFASADMSSSNALSKQISLSSVEILNQYKIDAKQFMRSERMLRCWICGTILQPLIENIDSMNALFAKDYSSLHLKIGRSTVQMLRSALSTKLDLLGTQLPYIIPYLNVHEKQAYIVKRLRVLSADSCMLEYNWQSGGGEPVEKENHDDRSYSPAERPWGEHLPTDTQLIWSWFCTYMDTRMAANAMAGDFQTPFLSVFYLKKPSKPSAVQCAPDSFYIHQVSVHPPQFELVVEGGRERYEMSRGPKNLWRTIILFLQHVRLFNNGRIGELAIDETGINIACVLE